MAMEKNDDSEHGFAVTAAYHRIAYVRGDPTSAAGLNVFVDSYKSKADRDAGVKAFRRREYQGIVIDWAAGAPGARLYTQIKASNQNDAFFSADVTDVLE